MYRTFYNIKFEPFSTIPSPDIFYDSGIHQDAWQYLEHGLSCLEPLLLITGDHGTGKTLLCLKLLRKLQQKNDCFYVYIPVPVYSYEFLLHEIARQLDIPVTTTDEAAIQYLVLQHFTFAARGSSIYILLDDVHTMKPDVFTKLLLLADFNYHEFFPVKFSLFAHCSMLDELRKPELLSLQYKLKRPFLLTGLNLPETKEYIYFRLLKAEAPGIPAFTEDAIKEIHSLSKGIPLLINKICDVCLMLGAEQKAGIIELPLVVEAQKVLDGGIYKEEKTETKVNLIQEPHIAAPSIDVNHAGTEGAGNISNQQMLSTLHSLTAFFILVLIFLCSALAVMSYYQYRLISSFKNIAAEVKPASPPVPDGKSRYFPPVTMPAEKPPVFEERSFSSVAPVPASTSVNNTSEAAPTTAPANTQYIPHEDVQPTTALSPPYTPEESTTTQKTIIETTAPALPEKTVRYPYSIQLASYNSLPGAMERMALFKDAGLSPYLTRSLSRQTGEVYWVIYSGYYRTREEAERFRRLNNLNDALVTKTPFANLVGVYTSHEEMADMIKKLERAGQFPYVIEDTAATLRLYVGAFTTRRGAESHKEELLTVGINATPEER
jgi:type II secretory pathway predicted ATPase ExeA/cell division protein FtsN